MKTIEELFTVQSRQQEELGLDPVHQDSQAKRRLASDLAANLVEEGALLQTLFGSHKRHLLRQSVVPESTVAEKCVDVVKLAVALAQLYGIDSESFYEAFMLKTRVVRAKALQERKILTHDTKIVALDMDQVICDISPWLDNLARLRGDAPLNAKTLAMMEEYKHEFYTSGRFGSEFTPVEGAVEGVRKLQTLGYKIVIITARPQWQYKRLYGDTIDWLRRYGVPHDFLLFNKDKVEAICTHLKPAWPAFFVEDLPKNAMSLAAAGVPVLLFKTKDNVDFKPPIGVLPVAGWNAVLDFCAGSDRSGI